MGRLIIVEGPDGAGKSTLIAELTRRFRDEGCKVHVSRNGPYLGEKKIAHRYRGQIYRALYGYVNTVVIVDRAWHSEPIYAAATGRGAPRVSVPERRTLERLALRADAVLILCRPPYTICREAWAARKGEEYLTRDTMLRKVYDAYGAAAPHHQQPLIQLTYDYTKDSMDHVFLKLVSVPRSPRASTTPGLGAWREGKSIALIGHEMSVSRSRDLPFTGSSGSSPWLADQLEGAKVSEADLYWANAYHCGEAQRLDWLGWLSPRKVIALGSVAAATLALRGINHVQVPHPQFWKRFHFSKPYPLLRQLS